MISNKEVPVGRVELNDAVHFDKVERMDEVGVGRSGKRLGAEGTAAIARMTRSGRIAAKICPEDHAEGFVIAIHGATPTSCYFTPYKAARLFS